MDKVELYFDGELFECYRQEDRNGEHLFVTENGRFVKFPAGGDLDELISKHNVLNSKKVEVIPDVTYGRVETFPMEPTSSQ